MALYAGGVASGKPREQGVLSRQAHWFTPESDRSTHYFYASTKPRSEGEKGKAFVDFHAKALFGPFNTEDAPIIEAQQRNLGQHEFGELKPLILGVDAAGAAARRIVARKLKAERPAES
jgi:vanillate O-demethylase monooxygenase subunit